MSKLHLTLPGSRRPRRLPDLPPAADALIREYCAYRAAAGFLPPTRSHLWGVRSFLHRYPDLESWRQVALAEQAALPRPLKAFLAFLFLRFYLRPTLAYLLTCGPKLAELAKRHFFPEIYTQFESLCQTLGWCLAIRQTTLRFLFSLVVYLGKLPAQFTPEDMALCQAELAAYPWPAERFFLARTYRQNLYRVALLLFHAGILPESLPRYNPHPALAREAAWAEVPEAIREVAWRYLDQLAAIRAPATVISNEGYLRRFFLWLHRTYPDVQTLPGLTRQHIEAFKLWLRNTPSTLGQPFDTATVRDNLGTLGRFLLILQEWDWPEAPTRSLVFRNDLPVREQPLPRFLEDGAAAALLRAAQASPDLFTRVCIETLLRTGLRLGEFMRLELDSVVQIDTPTGLQYWLRVPLGKLHNDRYVPLHPAVKQLLDEWIAQRGTQLNTPFLFTRYGKPICKDTVTKVVHQVAQAAGIESAVTPHRLRHTLATQAINRGMSLEAIAALLGHRSLTMTLVYARIANQTVQRQYVAVCDDLDKLYAEAALSDTNALAQAALSQLASAGHSKKPRRQPSEEQTP